MKKYLSLFLIAIVIGFFWDIIQGLPVFFGKSESRYGTFLFVAIPALMGATFLLGSDVRSTLTFWLKSGFYTWLALTPLFCFQAMNTPQVPIWIGAVVSLEWLPTAGSAVVLFQAWKFRKSSTHNKTTAEAT